MNVFRKRTHRAAALSLVVAAAGLVSCGRSGSEQQSAATNAYIDSARCQSCHPSQHRSFQHVGMSRSFSRVTAVSSEAYSSRHSPSGRYYEVRVKDGKLFQRRYEKDAAGNVDNDFELDATHVVGSGNHARTYLHQTSAGELVELPLTWYAETGTWGMSPGFDNPRPPDFTRLADESCLFCHNGYPKSDGTLANGIDCQRCHGPGGEHERRATARASASDVRSAIVNPAHLSPERQLDVCMQCHLETTSSELPQMLRRFDREPYSFVPGQPLGAYMVHFDHAPGSGFDDKFEIVNQAYRMRKSACFLKSGGKLTCNSCHDPHSVPRGKEAVAYYREKCVSCHASVSVAAHPALATADCRGCHMPRRRAQDAVHAVMTDHLVRRRPATDNLLQPLKERSDPYRGDLVVYYPHDLSAGDRDLYLGAAMRNGGTDRMERSLDASSPARAFAVLGEKYLKAGDANTAIQKFQTALSKDPQLRRARFNLAQALETAGMSERAVAEYQRAIASSKVAFPEAEFGLANLLVRTGDVNGAEAHYLNAIAARSVHAEARNNLANLYLERGLASKAKDQLEQALRIDPAFADAHNNLARVLANEQQTEAALQHAARAVALRPDFAEARFNYGQLLQAKGSVDAAIAEYRSALKLQPRMIPARLSLGAALADAGKMELAIAEFREVLRQSPGDANAQRMLDMALSVRHGTTR